MQAYGLQEKIGRVLIPTGPVTEIVNGKKRTVERAFLHGYVLVEMALDDEIWHLLKNTPKVTGFLGTGGSPTPLSEEPVSTIVLRWEAAKDQPRDKVKVSKNQS